MYILVFLYYMNMCKQNVLLPLYLQCMIITENHYSLFMTILTNFHNSYLFYGESFPQEVNILYIK